jgi:hypothetical protein
LWSLFSSALSLPAATFFAKVLPVSGDIVN